MRTKRYSAEQIVAKLREAEKLQAQGLTIPQACKRLGISDQTFYRWRIKYGALKEDEAQRLKALEQENSRLKKIVAEQALDISLLKDLQRGNWCARRIVATPCASWCGAGTCRSVGPAKWSASTARRNAMSGSRPSSNSGW